jgi:hypothetical protein
MNAFTAKKGISLQRRSVRGGKFSVASLRRMLCRFRYLGFSVPSASQWCVFAAHCIRLALSTRVLADGKLCPDLQKRFGLLPGVDSFMKIESYSSSHIR